MSKCLAPLSETTPSSPPVLRFLQSLLSLLGADPSIVEIPNQAETQPGAGPQKSSLPRTTTPEAARHPPPPSSEYYTTSTTSMPVPQMSPMSVQQIVSGYDQAMNTSKPVAEKGESPWLLGGNGNGAVPSAVTQATWQQWFTSAGTPFTADNTNILDLQGKKKKLSFDVLTKGTRVGWESLFFDQNGNTMNMYQ